MALLCAVSATIASFSGPIRAEQGRFIEKTAQIEVGGKLVQESGKSSFTLTINYSSAARETLGDALLVYAEPSHTLLFIHVNTRGSRAKSLAEENGELEPALARVYSPGQSFRHTLSLPYDARKMADTRIDVVMKSRGQEFVLASGRVNVTDFQYTTTFSVITLPDGSTDYLGGTHCCSGPQCTKMCTTCPGAFFSCDLVTCTINCESF